MMIMMKAKKEIEKINSTSDIIKTKATDSKNHAGKCDQTEI